LLTTILWHCLAFFPAQQITSLWSYEKWMVGMTMLFIGAAAFFFLCTAGGSKRLKWRFEPASVLAGGSYVERCNSKRADLSKLHKWKMGKRFERKDVSSLRPVH